MSDDEFHNEHHQMTNISLISDFDDDDDHFFLIVYLVKPLKCMLSVPELLVTGLLLNSIKQSNRLTIIFEKFPPEIRERKKPYSI